MRLTIFSILSILSATLFSQVETPTSSLNCEIHSKNNFSYCLDTKTYKIQWTASKIMGSDIENQIYLPPDYEFFKNMPVSIIPIWQVIELQTNFWAMEFDSVFVVTGVLNYEKDSIASTAYYKAILKGCKGDALAFFVDTKSTDTEIDSYGITINKLEELTEMDFFPTLDPDLQEIFEANFNWEFWPILSKQEIQ